MKNIRFLTQHIAKKQSTEYAVFFEHDGLYARLDWELADSADSSVANDLMLNQIFSDLNDEETIEEIRESNRRNKNGSRLERMLEDGYVEQDAYEFKAKAIERFGES
jgi:hypothetical protein